MTAFFHSFDAFSGLSKGQLFMIDVLNWAPENLVTWFIETDKRPGIVKLRENRAYAHEVAAKLIKEKRQELKDGTSQRDVLTLLGSSCLAFVDVGHGSQSFSQGKFLHEARLATPRRRNCGTSSVNHVYCFLIGPYSPEVQDNLVRGPRDYSKNGQFFSNVPPNDQSQPIP